MLTLRLARAGTKKRPVYHLVAADKRSRRDGRFIENLGYYIPGRKVLVLKQDRISYWMSVGAQTSETAKNLIKKAKKHGNVEPVAKARPVAEAAPEAKAEAKAKPETDAKAETKTEEKADDAVKVIDGKKYDKKMLEVADESVAGKGDGRISKSDAEKLLAEVKDGNEYSDVEKATMAYIRDNYKFTEEADAWFRSEIRKWAAAAK